MVCFGSRPRPKGCSAREAQGCESCQGFDRRHAGARSAPIRRELLLGLMGQRALHKLALKRNTPFHTVHRSGAVSRFWLRVDKGFHLWSVFGAAGKARTKSAMGLCCLCHCLRGRGARSGIVHLKPLITLQRTAFLVVETGRTHRQTSCSGRVTPSDSRFWAGATLRTEKRPLAYYGEARDQPHGNVPSKQCATTTAAFTPWQSDGVGRRSNSQACMYVQTTPR